MDERIERLAREAQGAHGCFTRAQARALGLTRHALRNGIERGRWVPLSPGVLCMAGVAMGPLTMAMAAVLDAGAGAVLSHTSAAWLLGLPGFALSPVHVTRVGRGERRPTTALAHRTARLPSEHARLVAGIRVTSPARTLFDLGAVVRPERLERALDTALARRLVTVEALHDAVEVLGAPGRTGGAVIRRLLAARDGPPPESELERRFLRLVHEYGLPPPRRQVVLGDDREQAGRVDFYFPEARLVVEVDGRPFHSALLDRTEDSRRDLVVVGGGGRVVRLTWHHVVHRPAEVAARLKEAITRVA